MGLKNRQSTVSVDVFFRSKPFWSTDVPPNGVSPKRHSAYLILDSLVFSAAVVALRLGLGLLVAPVDQRPGPENVVKSPGLNRFQIEMG